MKKFWDWKNRTVTNEETQEQIQERTLFLNGTIAEESWFDDDVTPQLFKDELMSGSGNITVWINSPGGDCVAAAQIYNMLMDYHGDVTVKIDGIAASAASVIAMAGTKVLMSPTALMMIYTSPYAPELAAGQKTVAFGDFNYYWIGDRLGITFKRLNERFAETGQIGFIASKRLDGKLILPEAIKVLQQKGTASSGT